MTLNKSNDTRTILWSLKTGRAIHEFPGEVAGEFSPSGRYIVTFSLSNNDNGHFDAAVWRTSTGQRIASAALHQNSDPYRDTLHFSKTGQRFVHLSNGAFLPYNSSAGAVYKTRSGRNVGSIPQNEVEFGGHRLTTDGMLATFDTRRARLIDIASNRTILNRQHEFADGVWGSVWSHDGSKVAIIQHGSKPITFFDMNSGRLTIGPKIPTTPRRAIISPDGRRMAIRFSAQGKNPELRMYNMEACEGAWAITLDEHGQMLGFSPDSSMILVGGIEIAIVNAHDGRTIRSFSILGESR